MNTTVSFKGLSFLYKMHLRYDVTIRWCFTLVQLSVSARQDAVCRSNCQWLQYLLSLAAVQADHGRPVYSPSTVQCQSQGQKIVPKGEWGHLLTLTLTLDDLESHIVVNVSSTTNIRPSFIKIGRSRFCGKLWSQKSRDSITRRKFKNPARETLSSIRNHWNFFDWLKNGGGDRFWKSSFWKLCLTWPWPWPRMTLEVILSWMTHRP